MFSSVTTFSVGTHVQILNKHLLPRFEQLEIASLTRQRIQAFCTTKLGDGYAPHSVHHFHEVLSAVLRTAVEWGHIDENPAHGVSLPRLQLKRPKWVLTPQQAANLIEMLPDPSKTMVTVALLTGLRRGELLALRWRSLDEEHSRLVVSEAVYDEHFDTPKTTAGNRFVPIAATLLEQLQQYRKQSKRQEPDDLIFSARNGRPVSQKNLLDRHIGPACEKLKLRRATWITFRRTYSSWSHQKGIPDKLIAELMGHANVYTTLNVYTQVMDESRRSAAEQIGNELFNIVQFPRKPHSRKKAAG